MRFTAHTVRGSGRGKDLNAPTINVDLNDVPADLKEGIYACHLYVDDIALPGAMHYGPRPVFGDSPSCEVHVIDEEITNVPETVDIEIVSYIREVQNFASTEDLEQQIHADIAQIRGILGISND